MIHRTSLFLLALIVVGCASLTAEPELADQPTTAPTDVPAVATAVPAAPATATPPPFNLSTPAIVIEQPVTPVSPTLIPPHAVLPDAKLVLYRPGTGSHVTSPFQIFGRGGPSFNERVHLRLLGEDGRIITEHTTYLFAFPGNAGNFVANLEFEVPALAENARLEVSTDGTRNASMDQLVTVDLVLLTEGSARVHPALHGPEKLAILRPSDGSFVEGGVINVRGAGWVDSDLPIIVQLIDRNGETLARHEVRLDTAELGTLGTFELQIPYQIPYSQYVRVAVSEQHSVYDELVHYSSVEVWLKP